MQLPEYLTDFERGQVCMRRRAAEDLTEHGRISASERIALLPILPDRGKVANNAERAKQRMEDYGPFPAELGTLQVAAMVDAAHYADARAIGGVAPVSTALFALLRYASQLSTRTAPEVPMGAILNGTTCLNRVEDYGFHGSDGFTLAEDPNWHEARRCFQAMADYITDGGKALPVEAPEPAEAAPPHKVTITARWWQKNGHGGPSEETDYAIYMDDTRLRGYSTHGDMAEGYWGSAARIQAEEFAAALCKVLGIPAVKAPERPTDPAVTATSEPEGYTGAGDLDAGAPNHTDHDKRGFQPK